MKFNREQSRLFFCAQPKIGVWGELRRLGSFSAWRCRSRCSWRCRGRGGAVLFRDRHTFESCYRHDGPGNPGMPGQVPGPAASGTPSFRDDPKDEISFGYPGAPGYTAILSMPRVERQTLSPYNPPVSKRTEQSDPARAALRVITVLQEAGHTAYLAGGCVRDRLRGAEPKDYDVATDARPEQVRELFRNSRWVGQAFGVVLVMVKHVAIEVATFRTEWGYEDGRHPDGVEFSDAEHDAGRRDFTVNGLFENPLARNEGDRIIDYVDGRADLEHKLIRAIGDAGQRLSEDYLRLLRAPRFAASLGFDIEEQTANAIIEHASQLGKISRERIGNEIRNMFAGPDPARAAQLMQTLRLDAPVLDEQNNPCELMTLATLGATGDFALGAAAWMLDRHVFGAFAAPCENFEQFAEALGDFARAYLQQTIGRWRHAMTLSNDECDEISMILGDVISTSGWDELTVARRKRLLARPTFAKALHLLRAMQAVTGVSKLLQMIETDSQQYEREGVAPTPWVTGHDLIALGKQPGPDFARLLDAVYDAQLERRVQSRDEALVHLRDLINDL